MTHHNDHHDASAHAPAQGSACGTPAVKCAGPIEPIVKVCFFVGLAAAALSLAGFFFQPKHFWDAYLTGFLFTAMFPLGSLAILLVHGLTTGGWGLVIRKYAESATRTFPVLFVLFIPVLLNLKSIYPWAAAVVTDPLVLKKAAYLNIPGFIIRTGVFFVIWTAVAALVRTQSRKHSGHDENSRTNLQLVCGLGMLLFIFASTFAAFDWGMSLTPQWFSTIFGIMTVIGNALGAIAFLILLSGIEVCKDGEKDPKTVQGYHDLGNLALALVMLWAYMNFSQFFIIWSANLPEEILWYLPRYRGGWQWVGIGLILVHFFIPFFLLLNRMIKKNVRFLSRVALWILAVRLIDQIWTVAPGFVKGAGDLSWLYLTLPAAIAGLWMAAFGYQLRRAS
jgi:hypothetical protein